jgi:hypothetical protein
MAAPRLVHLALTGAILAGTTAVPSIAHSQEATPSTVRCEIPFEGDYEVTLAESIEVKELSGSETANRLDRQRLRAFNVDFTELYAAIPRCWYPEQMVVIVETGQFVLELGDDNVTIIAEPNGNQIPLMEYTGTKPPHYAELSGETVQDVNGQPCTSTCALPANAAVLLEEGSRVYLPGQSVCLWCLLNGKEGKLRVYAVVPDGGTFSWERLSPGKLAGATAERFTSTRLHYNPGVNCRGG